uniref:Uncharacterized protein n=1 Tax=Cacopsylla melanoneura TaxID=428564 RepID=A0A8D8TL55_9HEMI
MSSNFTTMSSISPYVQQCLLTSQQYQQCLLTSQQYQQCLPTASSTTMSSNLTITLQRDNKQRATTKLRRVGFLFGNGKKVLSYDPLWLTYYICWHINIVS